MTDYRGAIEGYYGAFRNRDLERLKTLLTPDFHFVSAFAEYHERDSMLEKIWPSVGQSWATNVRIYGSAPEFVVTYEHENAKGADRPSMRMAEWIRFRGDKIAEIEVFVGRPLTSQQRP